MSDQVLRRFSGPATREIVREATATSRQSGPIRTAINVLVDALTEPYPGIKRSLHDVRMPLSV